MYHEHLPCTLAAFGRNHNVSSELCNNDDGHSALTVCTTHNSHIQ